MWIMGGNKTELICSEAVERFALSNKENSTLIIASYSVNDARCVTLARYQTEAEAYNELCDLCDAMVADMPVYFMKASTGTYKPEMKAENHNGRKRKNYGGS